MAVTRTPIAATPAFDLDALKLHARVPANDDDDSLYLMGDAAVLEIEAYCDIALLRQEIGFVFETTSSLEAVELPIGPLAPDAEFTINGTPATPVHTSGRYPTLTLPDGLTGEVIITYKAGFGYTATSIPADLQLAILDQAARLFDMRGAADGKQGLSPAAARICARYRRVRT